MNIRPLQDQLLVRRDPEDEVSAGGIIIPDAANNPKLPRGRGVVLAVGPGLKKERVVDEQARSAIRAMLKGMLLGLGTADIAASEAVNELQGHLDDSTDAYEPMDVKVGDRVVFSKLSGDKVRDDLAQQDVDDDLLLIRESEIIAVLEQDDAAGG